MKKIISLCLLLSSLMIYSQNRKTDLQNEGLKGKVKSVREIPYKAVEKEGKIKKGRILSVFDRNENIEYDIQGNRVNEKRYYPDNSLGSEFIYRYDNQNNIIKEGRYYGEENLITKWVYSYDDQGNKREMILYKNDSVIMNITYRYDNQGNNIEESWYNKDGNLYNRQVYSYDDQGNQVEMSLYGANSRLDIKWIYYYDEKGNKIGWNIYEADGSEYSKYTYQYQYDDRGNWIEKLEYRDDKPYTITTREIEYYK